MKTFKKINELREKDYITEEEMFELKKNHCIDMMEKLLDELEKQAGI